MQKYLKLMKHLAQEFDKLEFVKIPRGQNMAVDEIAKMASSKEGLTSMELNVGSKSTPALKKSQHLQSRVQTIG